MFIALSNGVYIDVNKILMVYDRQDWDVKDEEKDPWCSIKVLFDGGIERVLFGDDAELLHSYLHDNAKSA